MRAIWPLLAAVAVLVAGVLWIPSGPGNQAAWTVVALAVAALALGAGLARFDEARLTTRDVALVATLGATAGAVRVPLAALPGVQPTTFLVVAVGAVLGPLNGFVVGVLAAVSSNMVLGHGPWTLFQALGWGLGGVAGHLVWRRLDLRGLAALGLAWGFVFGALTNVSVWVTTQPVLTLRTYLGVAALSLVPDALHGATTALLFLVAGPPVIRVLRRARQRLVVRYEAPPAKTDASAPEPGR